MCSKLFKSKASFIIGLFMISFSSYGNNLKNGCQIYGNENAKITIEEFADFQCRYCSRGSNIINEVIKNYPDTVKVIFRNLPLQFHTHSMAAAKMFSSACIQSPSLAYKFQNEIFQNQDKLEKQGEEFLYDTAEKIGINMDQLVDDMASNVVLDSIKNDKQLATQYNFTGTPSFKIGSELITGARPYNEIKKIIDKQL